MTDDENIPDGVIDAFLQTPEGQGVDVEGHALLRSFGKWLVENGHMTTDTDGLVIVDGDEVQHVHTDDGAKDAQALAAYLEQWDFSRDVISELSHVEFVEGQND